MKMRKREVGGSRVSSGVWCWEGRWEGEEGLLVWLIGEEL
jgi:hypothetical protein